MKKILLALLISLFTSSIFASDDKPGRFFEDQPDINDDFQIHFIYSTYRFNYVFFIITFIMKLYLIVIF